MRRRTATRNILAACAASSFPNFWARALAQTPQDFVLRSDVRLVLLDVSVRNRHGEFVPNLAENMFHVLENGSPQTITVFAHEDLPVNLGILVDESGSMGPKRRDVLLAATTFIEASNPHDEIFVLNFNDRVSPGLPRGVQFSDDVAQLRAALFRGVPQGRTAIYDAVIDGLQRLNSGTRNKKGLIVISDGGDNASTHTKADMLAALERSTATIYTIGLVDPDEHEGNIGMLKQLSEISGGDSFFPQDPALMTAVCRKIAVEIRRRYTIGYVPPAENRGPLRHIQVRVSAPGNPTLIARTRTRYRYDERNTNSQ